MGSIGNAGVARPIWILPETDFVVALPPSTAASMLTLKANFVLGNRLVMCI